MFVSFHLKTALFKNYSSAKKAPPDRGGLSTHTIDWRY